MSLHAFVESGESQGLLGIKQAHLGDREWPVEVHDLGENHLLGCRYPDGARMANPRKWFPEFENALRHNRAEKGLPPPHLPMPKPIRRAAK